MNTINPEKIIKLNTSIYSSYAFLAGMQLDIFTLLEDSLSLNEISAKLAVKSNYIERLLYSLVSAELIVVENGIFSNTKEAGHYLVQGKPSYMGNHVFVNPFLNFWNWGSAVKIADDIRSDKIDKFDYSSSSQEDLLEMFRSTMPIAIKAGEELANYFDFRPYKTLADISGASGGLASSIAKKYPHLKIVVTDLASVTPVSRILLDEQGSDEIGIQTWDVLDGPCSKSFDVLILRALIQVLSPDDAQQALTNIGKSVNPGGVIMILGHIMDDNKASPVEEVGWYLLNLHWDDEAGFYSEKDHRDMLNAAGFCDIKYNRLLNGDGLIIAYRK